MEYKELELDQFFVIGISVRTNNKAGKAQKDIGELWSKFFKQNIIEQIPDKISNDIFCIYTDYQSDFMGDYTTILACKVKSLNNIPEGLVGKKIPKTKYWLCTAKGAMPTAVGIAWGNIWQTDINRKYIADFDVYNEKSQQGENSEVDIFLSVN